MDDSFRHVHPFFNETPESAPRYKCTVRHCPFNRISSADSADGRTSKNSSPRLLSPPRDRTLLRLLSGWAYLPGDKFSPLLCA